MKISSLIIGCLSLFVLSGCVSISDINNAFRDVENAWEIENNKQADRIHRVVNSSYKSTFDAVEKTFYGLNMTITKISIEKGYVMSRNKAPKPLSKVQWEEVRKIENPKLKKISSIMSLSGDPSDYFVTIRAKIENLENGSSVTLDYYLDVPKYEDMGLIPENQVPPHALILMTEIFWSEFDKHLSSSVK